MVLAAVEAEIGDHDRPPVLRDQEIREDDAVELRELGPVEASQDDSVERDLAARVTKDTLKDRREEERLDFLVGVDLPRFLARSQDERCKVLWPFEKCIQKDKVRCLFRE